MELTLPGLLSICPIPHKTQQMYTQNTHILPSPVNISDELCLTLAHILHYF